MLFGWTKEQVRRWLYRRAKDPQPLPEPREMRRQLGRDMIEEQRKARKRVK